MTDAIIVSGGNIRKDFALDFLKKNRKEGTCLIAADRGVEFFLETRETPDVVVGDFDSFRGDPRSWRRVFPQVEILQLMPEKDDSDTQHAVNYAMERGAEKIFILGATGRRLDHFMANLELLLLGKKRGVPVILADSHNYIALAESGTVLKRQEQFGRYISFFPMNGDVYGLTLRGFRYPLLRHHLTAEDCGLTVSNEIADDQAEIFFEKGTLLMMMTRD